MKNGLVLLCLAASFLLFLSAWSVYASTSVLQAPPLMQSNSSNTTTTTFNVTLRIETCDGEALKEGSLLPHVVVKKNGTAVFSGDCSTCTIDGLEYGVYQVYVKWRGVNVYENNILVNSTNSLVEIPIKTATKRVGVTVLNDEGSPIMYRVSATITLPSGDVGFEPGVTHILPFGTWSYSAKYSWMCNLVVSKSGQFPVSCGSSFLRISLPVAAEVVVKFRKSDGSSVLGLPGNASIYAVVNGKKAVTVDFREKDAVSFINMPYGSYRVVVAYRGLTVVNAVFNVKAGGDRQFTYTVPVTKSLTITFLDADDNPLVLFPVVVETPWGEKLRLGTNENGQVSIKEAMFGTYVFTSSLQGVILKKSLKVEKPQVEVKFPVRKSVLMLTPKGSASLPPGLRVKVVLPRTGYVVKEETLGKEASRWTLNLGLLLVDASYEADVSYMSYTWNWVVSAKPVIEVKVPLYDVKIDVETMTGEPLTGCNITLSYGGESRNHVLEAGGLMVRHLPDTDVNVGVACRGVEVFHGSFRPSSVNGTLTLKAYVTDLRVVVKGWFGKPIGGANVTLLISNDGKRLVFHSYTDANGVAVFKLVPVPPGSTAEALVRYKNEESRVVVDTGKSVNNVFLDVFLDTPLGALGLSTTVAMVVGLSVAGIVSLLLLRRYKYVKEVEGLLVPEDVAYSGPYYYGDEYEEEGVLERIKEFIRELLGRNEEEGEGIFFD